MSLFEVEENAEYWDTQVYEYSRLDLEQVVRS